MVVPNMNSNQQSAFSIITDILDNYGLRELIPFVNNYIRQNDSVDPDVLMGQLREQPAYQQRFAGNEARRRAGLPVLSEQEYLGMERAYAQLMRASGLPNGFYDSPADFRRLIENDVSVAEMSQRIENGYQAVKMANPEVVNQMRRLYGVTESQLAAYFLDPNKAAPVLMRQAEAAQIAAQGRLQAGMGVTAQQAEELAQAGVTSQEAAQGFAAIQEAQGLFRATTQEEQVEGRRGAQIGQAEQIGAVFGTNAAAAQRLRQRARRRQTEFERGGGFATGEAGAVTGVQ